METTLAQDCKKSVALVRFMLILSCSSEIYIFCIYVFGLKKWYIYVNAICTSAKTRRFSPVAVRLIKHRPVPGRESFSARTGIVRFVKRSFYVLGAWQTSYDVRPGTVRCPVGHRWNRTIKCFYKNRPVPVRCVQTPAGRRPGTVRCPADVI